jgi:hypothetical protein
VSADFFKRLAWFFGFGLLKPACNEDGHSHRLQLFSVHGILPKVVNRFANLLHDANETGALPAWLSSLLQGWFVAPSYESGRMRGDF